MKEKGKKTLKFRISLFVAGMLLLMASVNLFVGMAVSYGDKNSLIEDKLVVTAGIIERTLHSRFESLEEQVEALARFARRHLEEGKASQQILKAVEGEREAYGFLAVGIVSADGMIRSLDPVYDRQNVSDEASFQFALEEKMVCMFTSEDNDGRRIIGIWAPIDDSGQAVMAVLDFYTYYAVFSDTYFNLPGEILLFDKDGLVIGGTIGWPLCEQIPINECAGYIPEYGLAVQAYTSQMESSPGDRRQYRLTEDKYNVCILKELSSGSFGGYLSMIVPRQGFMETSSTILSMMMLSSMVVLLLGFALASQFADSVTSPLLALSKWMEKRKDGDLHTTLPVTDNMPYEISILVENTAGAAEAVNSRIDEIARLLEASAGGDLEVEPQMDYQGDFSRIKQSILKINGSFKKLLTAMKQSADLMEECAGQVKEPPKSACSAENLSAMADMLNLVIRNAQYAASTGEQIASANQRFQESVQKIERVTGRTGNGAGKVRGLEGIVDALQKQMDALSLNVSAEAVRAGAAVTDEMHGLSGMDGKAFEDKAAKLTHTLYTVERALAKAQQSANKLEALAVVAQETVSTVECIAGQYPAASI